MVWFIPEVPMNKDKYLRFCKKKHLEKELIENGIDYVMTMEKDLNRAGLTPENTEKKVVQEHVDHLISKGENSYTRLALLAYYFHSIDRRDLYIYFTQLLGVRGVIENIRKRAGMILKEENVLEDIQNISSPPLGSSPSAYPPFIQTFMKLLKRVLSTEEARWVLAGNNHQIPKEAFEKEKEHFLQSETLDDYLRAHHERSVETLQQHADEGTIWFEQLITPEVVSFVRENPEILGGVRHNDKIYVTKIPYNPSAFIKAKVVEKKRYHACHCGFVREHLKNGLVDIDPDWCYCSAGFAKTLYEHLFERELEAELLQSPLTGEVLCRFAIRVPEAFL